MKARYYFLLVIGLGIFEISFFPFLAAYVPAFTLLLVVLAGLKVNAKFGLKVGVLGGLLIDISLGFAVSQTAIIYGLLGYLTGVLAKHFVDLGLVTFLLTSFLATLGSAFLAMFFLLAFGYQGWGFAIYPPFLGYNILANLIGAVFIYGLLGRNLSIVN